MLPRTMHSRWKNWKAVDLDDFEEKLHTTCVYDNHFAVMENQELGKMSLVFCISNMTDSERESRAEVLRFGCQMVRDELLRPDHFFYVVQVVDVERVFVRLL